MPIQTDLFRKILAALESDFNREKHPKILFDEVHHYIDKSDCRYKISPGCSESTEIQGNWHWQLLNITNQFSYF